MYTRQLKLPRSQATVTDPSPHAHVTKSNFPKLILSTHKIYLFLQMQCSVLVGDWLENTWQSLACSSRRHSSVAS